MRKARRSARSAFYRRTGVWWGWSSQHPILHGHLLDGHGARACGRTATLFGLGVAFAQEMALDLAQPRARQRRGCQREIGYALITGQAAGVVLQGGAHGLFGLARAQRLGRGDDQPHQTPVLL